MTPSPIALSATASTTLLVAASSAQAQQQGPEYYYGPHMWGAWQGMFFGPIFMIVFVAAIVALLVLLVRWIGGTHGPAPHAPAAKTPLDILKERFARGEIDAQEFEERRRVLGE